MADTQTRVEAGVHSVSEVVLERLKVYGLCGNSFGVGGSGRRRDGLLKRSDLPF